VFICSKLYATRDPVKMEDCVKGRSIAKYLVDPKFEKRRLYEG